MSNAATATKPDDDVPVQSQDVAAPSEDWQSVLKDFDQQTAPPPEAAPDNTVQNGQAQGDQIDQLLAELSGPTPEQQKIGELEGQLNSLQQQAFQKAELAAFDDACSKLQHELVDLGLNIDERFVKTNLQAMSVENPALEPAFRYRNLTPDQLRAADLEFKQRERQYNQWALAPDSPQKQQTMTALYRRGEELGLMLNSKSILQNARKQVVDRARSIPPALDYDAMETRADIAQAMRGASRPVNFKEPAPDFNGMSDNEYRNFIRKEYGISGF
jgi:hypothetical protein